MEPREAIDRLTQAFGSREQFLAHQLLELSRTGQPADVTFYHRPPLLDVKIDQSLALAMMYGAGAKKLQEMLNDVKLSGGATIRFGEIWTINPMPKAGIPQHELDAVDLTEGDERVGPGGETLRQMIKETYHCKTKEEEERFLRRFIAS